MKRAAIPLLTGLVLVTLTIVAPAAVSVDKLLTVADVETATGRAGVRAIPRDPSKGAGGDLNFADARGEILVMIQVVEAKYYPEFKKAYFTAALAGVGDEAFTGASLPGKPENFACFRKGDRCVAVTGFLDLSTGKPALNRDQVVALARVVVSRM
jgi:hypothetical protein